MAWARVAWPQAAAGPPLEGPGASSFPLDLRCQLGRRPARRPDPSVPRALSTSSDQHHEWMCRVSSLARATFGMCRGAASLDTCLCAPWEALSERLASCSGSQGPAYLCPPLEQLSSFLLPPKPRPGGLCTTEKGRPRWPSVTRGSLAPPSVAGRCPGNHRGASGGRGRGSRVP